jgi:2-polyprenyl-3-methyl-5-hydroxy-6-metoxy-1,4-benzoquinol methylase
MWDERYSAAEYVYGEEPNDFLVAARDAHLHSKEEEPSAVDCSRTCLLMADGEGRNGVYMAQQGFQVTSVDLSQEGLKKAQLLAAKHNVSITTVQADLADYDLVGSNSEQWDVIVGISCHFPPSIRERVLAAIPGALKPGGYVIFECYTPEQLNYKTGGPSDPDMMYTAEIFDQAFQEMLEILTNEQLVRNVVEGKFHSGQGSVVQLVARKPLPSESSL